MNPFITLIAQEEEFRNPPSRVAQKKNREGSRGGTLPA